MSRLRIRALSDLSFAGIFDALFFGRCRDVDAEWWRCRGRPNEMTLRCTSHAFARHYTSVIASTRVSCTPDLHPGTTIASSSQRSSQSGVHLAEIAYLNIANPSLCIDNCSSQHVGEVAAARWRHTCKGADRPSPTQFQTSDRVQATYRCCRSFTRMLGRFSARSLAPRADTRHTLLTRAQLTMSQSVTCSRRASCV